MRFLKYLHRNAEEYRSSFIWVFKPIHCEKLIIAKLTNYGIDVENWF